MHRFDALRRPKNIKLRKVPRIVCRTHDGYKENSEQIEGMNDSHFIDARRSPS